MLVQDETYPSTTNLLDHIKEFGLSQTLEYFGPAFQDVVSEMAAELGLSLAADVALDSFTGGITFLYKAQQIYKYNKRNDRAQALLTKDTVVEYALRQNNVVLYNLTDRSISVHDTKIKTRDYAILKENTCEPWHIQYESTFLIRHANILFKPGRAYGFRKGRIQFCLKLVSTS